MLGRRLLRIKALKALYAHIQTDGDNLIASQKRLKASVESAYNLYFMLLQLPVAMADYSRAQQKIASEKHLATYEDKNPNTKFVDSALVQLLEGSDSLNDYAAINKISWRGDADLIKQLFLQLSKSERFKAYMLSPERSINEDVELMEYFYVEVLQGCDYVEPAIESVSIMMTGDLSYVLPLVMRTLSSIRPSHTDIKVMKKYKNEADQQFVTTLFERALVNLTKYQTYIEKFTSNWDVERIVFMDNVILVVAMSELLNFPDIPTKVTMDEYIEISKFYSTPGSSTFVNGILDRITNSLNEEGLIKKSGRGLM